MEANFLDGVCHGRGRRNKSAQDRELQRLQARVTEIEQQNACLQAELERQHRNFRRALERTRFWLIGMGLPARSIASLLRECFGAKANRTGVLQLTEELGRRATQLMQEYFWPLARDADLDEVFIEGSPLYIASDPVSLAVLKTSMEEDRTVQKWSAFLKNLPNLERTTSDRGQAILGAVARRGNLVCQSDIFHPKAILHEELNVLEERCYALIAKEDAAQKKLQKTDRRGRDCRGAGRRLQLIAQRTHDAIELFDELDAAVKIAFDALRITTSDGAFNSPANARELLQFARAWIHEHLPDAWHRAKNALKDDALLTFLKELEAALPTIPVDTPSHQDRQFVLVTLARLWENQSSRRQRGKPVSIPAHVEQDLQNRCGNLAAVKQRLFAVLDQLHRASSGVECINSRVGFYRYSKRRFSGDFANLIAIRHNLTPFKEGKRAKQCPARILGATLPTFDLFELFRIA
jgi:hypothetical protein